MWADLRERRPGQMLDFMPEPDAELLAETLVAFANSDGGTILIGVDEGGRVTERVYADEVEVALRASAQECRPPVEVRWHQAAPALKSIRATKAATSVRNVFTARPPPVGRGPACSDRLVTMFRAGRPTGIPARLRPRCAVTRSAARSAARLGSPGALRLAEQVEEARGGEQHVAVLAPDAVAPGARMRHEDDVAGLD